VKIIQEVSLISRGSFRESQDWAVIQNEIRSAVELIVWPPGALTFTINPTLHGNGVKPIKTACMTALQENFGWQLETKIIYATKGPGRVDATKVLDKHLFALEWESGNISSSHRAVNKLVLGMLRGVFLGSALVLPSRSLYTYLTDRIGNYEELEPYFDVWRAVNINEGFLEIFVVEHDAIDNNVPRITKGTDGRALI
jgi:Restriction endonuclease BamHI